MAEKKHGWNAARIVSPDIWYYVNRSGSIDLLTTAGGFTITKRIKFDQLRRIFADATRCRKQHRRPSGGA